MSICDLDFEPVSSLASTSASVNRASRISPSVSRFCAFLLAADGSAAEPQAVTNRDVTGRGFAADLVNYTIDAPADGGGSLRVIDADGKPLPVQVTPGEQGKATLSFVAAVPPGGTSAYTIQGSAAGPAAAPAVTNRGSPGGCWSSG